MFMEFGVQWGATIALLSNLRGIHGILTRLSGHLI